MKVGKKQILKRGVAVLLAVLLAATMFSLASCGEKAKDAGGKDAPASSGQGVENPGSDAPVSDTPESGGANSPSGAGSYSAGGAEVASDAAAAPTEPVMGDIVSFGRYPQSLYDQENPTVEPSTGTEGVDWVKLKVNYFGIGNTCGNPPKDSIAYYKMEPIAWRVLGSSDGKLFLMSEKLIDAGPMHHDRYFTWETADMRRWLAQTFVGRDTGYPFTVGESGAVAATTVGGLGLGNETVDRVFLLSEAEAKNTALGFVSNAARTGICTQYANARYMYADSQWLASWWTRTRDHIADRDTNAFVRKDGTVITANMGEVSNRLDYAVRPALNLDISAVTLSLVSGDGPDGRTTWTATVPDTPTTPPSQPGSIASAAVGQIADAVWTGRQIKPAVSVKLGSKALALGKDYTVSYGANKDIGRGFATVTGKGSFTGAKSVTFKILPKTIKLKAAKAGKKRAKVTWKKASKAQGITGYEIRYKDKKSKKWKVKKAKAKAKAITVKKLKKGKAYKFQIRAYKAVGGEVYASPWSKTKKSKKIK
jgi:hypothetical protein